MNNLNYLNFFLFLIVSFIIMFLFFRLFKKNDIIHSEVSEFQLNKGKGIINSLGLSFLLILIISIFYLFFLGDLVEILPNRYYIFFISIIGLTFLSFYDDKKNIDPKIRLIFQLIFVYFSLTNIELQRLNLPFKLVIFFALVTWVYLINITNFLDGSDGHCGLHVLFFMIGILSQSFLQNEFFFSSILSFIIIPILLIYLIFYNSPPAKAFMGDTGSIFLGYIVGYIILEQIFMKQNFFVVSLFLYPILDCTTVLIKKTIKGYYPWAKLADCYFLIPIKNGHHHKKVFYVTMVYNFFNLLFFLMQNQYSKMFFILNLILSISLILYYKSVANEK